MAPPTPTHKPLEGRLSGQSDSSTGGDSNTSRASESLSSGSQQNTQPGVGAVSDGDGGGGGGGFCVPEVVTTQYNSLEAAAATHHQAADQSSANVVPGDDSDFPSHTTSYFSLLSDADQEEREEEEEEESGKGDQTNLEKRLASAFSSAPNLLSFGSEEDGGSMSSSDLAAAPPQQSSTADPNNTDNNATSTSSSATSSHETVMLHTTDSSSSQLCHNTDSSDTLNKRDSSSDAATTLRSSSSGDGDSGAAYLHVVGPPADSKHKTVSFTTVGKLKRSHRRSLSTSDALVLKKSYDETEERGPSTPVNDTTISLLMEDRETDRSRASSLLTNDTSSVVESESSDDEKYDSAREDLRSKSASSVSQSVEASDATTECEVDGGRLFNSRLSPRISRYSDDHVVTHIDDYISQESSEGEHSHSADSRTNPDEQLLTPGDAKGTTGDGDVATLSDVEVKLVSADGSPTDGSGVETLVFKKKFVSPLLGRRRTSPRLARRGLSVKEISPVIKNLKDAIESDMQDNPVLHSDDSSSTLAENVAESGSTLSYPVASNSDQRVRSPESTPAAIPPGVGGDDDDDDDDDCTSLDFVASSREGSPSLPKKAMPLYHSPSPLSVTTAHHGSEKHSASSSASGEIPTSSKDALSGGDSDSLGVRPSPDPTTNAEENVFRLPDVEMGECVEETLPSDAKDAERLPAEAQNKKPFGGVLWKFIGPSKKAQQKTQTLPVEGNELTVAKRLSRPWSAKYPLGKGKDSSQDDVALEYVPQPQQDQLEPKRDQQQQQPQRKRSQVQRSGSLYMKPNNSKKHEFQTYSPSVSPTRCAVPLTTVNETCPIDPPEEEASSQQPADLLQPHLSENPFSDSEQDQLSESNLSKRQPLSATYPELAIPEETHWFKTIDRRTIRKLKKEEKERQSVIHELLITEKHHYRHLKLLKMVFMKELSQVVSDDILEQMFPGIDKLIEVSEEFVKRLEEHVRTGSVTGDISKVLLTQFTDCRDKMFNAFAHFCGLHMNALDMYKEQFRKKNVNRVIKDLYRQKECQRLTLPDFYQNISSRLTKMIPTMQRLVKKTEMLKLSHTGALHQANKKFLELVAAVDQAVEDRKKHTELVDIQNRLEISIPRTAKQCNRKDLKSLDLLAHSRKLRKHGEATWQGNARQIRK